MQIPCIIVQSRNPLDWQNAINRTIFDGYKIASTHVTRWEHIMLYTAVMVIDPDYIKSEER